MNHSPVINQYTWECISTLMDNPHQPAQTNSLLFSGKIGSIEEFIVWDAKPHAIAHLYAGFALELLEPMSVNHTRRHGKQRKMIMMAAPF